MFKVSDFSLSKRESTFISGIALCMMLIHHFLGYPQWINDSVECIFLFRMGNLTIEQIIASSGALCVAIFAFNTGFVLYEAKEKFTLAKNLKRISNFLISYWIICLFFVGFGFIFNENLPTFGEFCLNLIGLDCSPLSYINVPFAWYVNFYITFILVTPLILFFTKGRNIKKDLFVYILWIVLSGFLFVFKIPVVTTLFKYGIISLTAYFIAKYKILSYLNFRTRYPVMVYSILAIFVLFFRFYAIKLINEFTPFTFSNLQDCIYAPLFILCVTNVFHALKEDSRITKLFMKTGALSMNMWFLHGIFFIGTMQIQWLLYWPKYSMLIIIWGWFLTYLMAYPTAKVQSYVLKKVNSIHSK